MKKGKTPRLSDIIPDERYRKEIEEGLLSGKPWIGEDGLFSTLLQSVVNASLEGELDHHLSESKASGAKNRRNGHGKKKVKTKAGELSIEPPRDRAGTFQPVIVEKGSRLVKGGIDEIILSLYAKGNSVEDIHSLLHQLYGIDYSTSAISTITNRVWPAILAWQNRPLRGCYLILYLDGIHFRVKEDGVFRDKCVYSLYAIDTEGQRDILGIYLSDNESSSQWGVILEDLQKRGLEDIFIACVDGLPGFKQAIQQVYPKTIVQRCIVHKIRNSVRFISDKDRKKLCSDLRKVYSAVSKEQAALELEVFEQKWPKHGKRIAKKWRDDWDELMAFMEFSAAIRKIIYTTNPVEALHRIIRKVTKSKGAWISEKALTKQLYLTLMQSEKSWKKKAFNHLTIQDEFAEKFGERFTQWIEN